MGQSMRGLFGYIKSHVRCPQPCLPLVIIMFGGSYLCIPQHPPFLFTVLSISCNFSSVLQMMCSAGGCCSLLLDLDSLSCEHSALLLGWMPPAPGKSPLPQ